MKDEYKHFRSITDKHLEDYPDDIKSIMAEAKIHGVNLTPREATKLWERYSEDMCASWLILPKDGNDLWKIIKSDLKSIDKRPSIFGTDPLAFNYEKDLEPKENIPVNGDTSGCGGKRYNQGKLQWKLMPFDALKGTVKVLEMGAKKYGFGNWEKGMNWTTCWDCLMRHAIAWRNGEDNDPESGENHLSHVVCNALFLIFYGLNNKGKDDRKEGI